MIRLNFITNKIKQHKMGNKSSKQLSLRDAYKFYLEISNLKRKLRDKEASLESMKLLLKKHAPQLYEINKEEQNSVH